LCFCRQIVEKRSQEHRKIDRSKTIQTMRENNYLNTVIESKLAEIESRFLDENWEEHLEENLIINEQEMMEIYYKTQEGFNKN